MTWGVQGALGILIFIVLLLMLIMQSGVSADLTGLNNKLVNDPFFILPLTLVGFAASFTALYFCIRFIHNRKFISVITTRSKINWMRILKGAAVWLTILGLFTVISFLISPETYEFTFNPSIFGIILILSLITFPIQASFEEVFFRGYLMQGFGLLFRGNLMQKLGLSTKKPIMPLLITSILFGAVHMANGPNMTMSLLPVIQAGIVGLMLGIITLGENGIETAMGIHIINNLYATLIVSTRDSPLGNMPSVLTAPSSSYIDVFLLVLFALIAITIIFWNKKDKLLDIFRWEDAEPN